MKRIFSLLLCVALILALLAGCGSSATQPAATEAPASEPAAEAEAERFLGLSWASVSIQFYSDLADLICGQAEADGVKSTVLSADFDVQKQISQLENMITMGVTDIVVLPVDEDALKDTLRTVREAGINVHSFAFDYGCDTTCFDTATVADQYSIGCAMGEVANEYINNTWADAADGEVAVAMITLPASTADKERDSGARDTISANPKASIVYEYEMGSQDGVEAQNAVDMILMQHPEVQVIVCHFASMAIAADERAMQHSEIDKNTFAIISGDTDDVLNERIISSLDGNSLIRGTGTYSPELDVIYPVTMHYMDDKLDEYGRYAFGTLKFNAEEMKAFVEG